MIETRVRFTEKQKKWIEKKAKKLGVSEASIVRGALDKYIENFPN